MKYGSKIIPSFDDADESCPNPIRIFVPLCGKTIDMAFLAKHKSISEIVGIDGIRKALDDFSADHDDLEITKVENQRDGYERLVGKSIQLLKGDFFELDDTITGGRFDAVWDRASIVAIDPSLRESYVATLRRLIKPGGSLLVSTLDRRAGTEEGRNAGPPYSVPESEIRRLYGKQEWVESISLLEEIDEFQMNPDQMPRYASQGVTAFFELVFEIKTKA